MLIKPLDAVLVEFTNDAAHLVDPARSIGLASNLWFCIVSVLFLTAIIAFITDRIRAWAPTIPSWRPKAPRQTREPLSPKWNRADCASPGSGFSACSPCSSS